MNKNLVIIAAVAVILFAGGALYLSNQKTTDNGMLEQNAEPTTTMNEDSMMEDEEEMMEEDDSMSDDSMMEGEDKMMEEDAVEVAMVGENYAFDPETFTVKAGQEVTVTLTSNDMMHDFVLEDMDVRTEVIQSGDSGSVTFTAPEEPGEYTYYCSVGNHRAMGMEGTMIVE